MLYRPGGSCDHAAGTTHAARQATVITVIRMVRAISVRTVTPSLSYGLMARTLLDPLHGD